MKTVVKSERDLVADIRIELFVLNYEGYGLSSQCLG